MKGQEEEKCPLVSIIMPYYNIKEFLYKSSKNIQLKMTKKRRI